MATSITPLANMSSMVAVPRRTSQLKVISPSANSSKLLRCISTPSNITLSSSIFFSGSSRFVPLVFSLSSFPLSRRRSGFGSSTRADAQSTEDPLVGNKEPNIEAEEVLDQEASGDEVPIEDSNDDEEKPPSVILTVLQSYKEALLNNDESKVAEVESFLQSIEQEKESVADELASLSEELSSAKERVLRISADFDNYRKRTERDRLSLVTNVQGEVVESLLPVLDNFERAKAQIKLETEGEEKINKSYQSIYKQFEEILASLGVVPVETVGSPFDPLLHEAIMREDSSEFEESIILQEFRKGFKLGDRLLRPSMVKVSAGPGPTKPKEAGTSGDAEAEKESSETAESS
ncbi:Grpe protein-like protein [Thalictrum thalictroides]|uniref:GrpE protein homolog n=1 Tax=Thalictrum thalictroides TaxID=46969 RepID=A0A7J6VR93_THATH|nr:Grpe protein-like protein [Thalictrum thalictroides]